MITEYTIENFKAFAGPATIPIKPITLIFGPNSSGKSSIFQSMLMLKQTIDEAKNKEDTLLPKGSLVDLGSYREFINNHDVNKRFSLKFTTVHPKYFALGQCDDTISCNQITVAIEECIEEKKVGLNFCFFNDIHSGILVSELDLFVDDDSIPLLTYENDCVQDIDSVSLPKQDRKLSKSFLKTKSLNTQHPFYSEYCKIHEEGLDSNFSIQLRNFLPELLDDQPLHELNHQFSSKQWANNVSQVTLSISNILRDFFDNLTHIGPLRQYPERFFTFSGTVTEYVGQTGKYMSDILINNKELVNNVNCYIDRLRLRYELRVMPLKSEAGDIYDLYAMRLFDKTSSISVSLTDVGFGVSQVLPIIVQSILVKEKTILIEQPELHLHPAQQAELGDLFIDAALGENKNTFLIETHSEHLILRILRRIRETTDGTLDEAAIPIRPDDVSVVYAKQTDNGTELIPLRITDDGDFAEKWPDGFFSERSKELF